MKKVIELRGITSIPKFYNEMVLVYSSNTLFFVSEQTGEIVHKICFDTWQPLEVLDGKLLMHRNDLFIYDDEIKNFVLYQNSINGGAISLYNNKIIENKYDRETNSVQVTLYDKDNKKLWQNFFSNRRGKRIFGEYLYVTDLSFRYIDFIDVSSGSVINTLHFENPPISRFIYYYEDTLIVSLNVGRNECHLLGLDARTGEEKWRIEDARESYVQDMEQGYLYRIGGNLFQIIDVKNGKLVCVDDLSSEIEKYKVFPDSQGCLSPKGLYFRSNHPDRKFGLLNIHTHKFEFVEDLGLEKGVWTKNIQYHNGRLYIQDTNDTLHIFAEE